VNRSPRRADPPGALWILTLVCAQGFISACGVQGLPHPPRLEQPAEIKDLALAQRGRTLEFTFSLPELAADGERLTKPLEAEILRAPVAADQAGPTAPGELSLWKELRADDLARYQQGKKIVLPLTLSDEEFRQQHGGTFAFGARTLTRGFRHRAVESDPSNVVQVILVDVSLPVNDLKIQAEEHALALSWSAPAQTMSGQPATNISAYRIYRSPTGKPGSFQLRGEVSGQEYRDAEFKFGRAYYYKVLAVSKQDGSVAESEESATVEITPRDVFPPAAPRGLTALYTTGVVDVIWTANSEPDLAGYSVYRREESGAAKQISQDILRTPLFRDSSVAAGRKYFYRVTALDLANNESPACEEVQVETR